MASLAVSCASNDSQGATANQQSTTIAPTTVPATTTAPTAAGQTVHGTGYSVSVPAGWSDVTAEQQQASSLKVDLALAGPETQGATSNLNVVLQPSQGSALAALAPQLREGLVQGLGASMVGQPERLSIAGTPAMALEYTYRLGGPLHAGLVVCQRGGRVYLVNFAAHPQAFTTDRAALDELLASWSWD
jgi:hypothetical protein